MRGSTHVTAGLTAALLMPNLNIPAMAALTLGSILPDIDHRDSLVGRHVPILPRLLKHRGVTHSLLFAVLCYGLYPPLGVGVLLHLLLDLLNPAGVALLWPWKKTDFHTGGNHCLRRRAGRCPTHGPVGDSGGGGAPSVFGLFVLVTGQRLCQQVRHLLPDRRRVQDFRPAAEADKPAQESGGDGDLRRYGEVVGTVGDTDGVQAKPVDDHTGQRPVKPHPDRGPLTVKHGKDGLGIGP